MVTTLSNLSFCELENWLLYDIKLSDKRGALTAIKSRFYILQRYFQSHNLEFNRTNFIAFVADEKKRGIADATINKFISLAKLIAKYLQIQGLEDLTYYRTPSQIDIDVLSWTEIRRLAEVMLPYRTSKAGLTNSQQNARMYGLIMLLGSVGCRINEALNLTWDNLHPEYVRFKDTKNGEDRACPIQPTLYLALSSLPKVTDKVFGLSDSSPSTINYDLKKRAEVIGLKKAVFPHVFRHSLITNLIKSGASLPIIAKLVGHRDMSTTNRYTHLILDDMMEMLYAYSPLWKETQSFNSLAKRVLEVVQRMVDNGGLNLVTEQNPKELVIKIRQN